MKALGASVQNDNSTHKAFANLKSKVRAAFWRNARHSGFRLLSASAKIDMIQRSTEPVMRFGASGIGPSKQTMDDLDHFQRGLFASILPLPRLREESDAEYFNRKREDVREHPACTGKRLWSYIWAVQVVNWDSHLSRERVRQAAHLIMPCTWSFAAQLSGPEHQHVLDTRRAQVSASGESRLRSRRLKRVHQRWHDAVKVARQRLPLLSLIGLG